MSETDIKIYYMQLRKSEYIVVAAQLEGETATATGHHLFLSSTGVFWTAYFNSYRAQYSRRNVVL
jgi:hypothetical protein